MGLGMVARRAFCRYDGWLRAVAAETRLKKSATDRREQRCSMILVLAHGLCHVKMGLLLTASS